MMGSWARGFDKAEKAMKKSTSVQVGTQIGAALFSGSVFLAYGYNVWNKTTPRCQHDTHNGNTHAEVMAVVKRWHYDKSKNLILYVSRITTNPEKTIIQYGCSRPCIKCMEVVREYGVRRIRFFDENGLPAELKL